MSISTQKTLTTITAGLLIAACFSTAHADSSDPDRWHSTLSLYAWGMNIDGTASIGPIDSDLNLDFKDDLLDNLAGAFMLHYEVKKNRLTLFGDYLYADLDPKTELPSGAQVDIDFKNKMWELGAAWDLTDSTANTTTWQIIGGIRSNKQEFRFQVGSPVLVSVNEKWYDGFIGGRVFAPFANNWQFVGRADIGAGDSDSVWNALAALDWRYAKWGSLMFGYRWLDYDYDNGKSGSERYAYDARQSGVIGALNFYF